ncbi:MAG: tRNA (adenosine(37)-N6)-threonylcarbamoyltransferase complex transferase subunit TsaD, partial [Clostridiaceae bacterium]|nr:tRNA (adenosine(37)-N6)-threonylcarbamoyltransferase complex transferase subunit TsaD [Clostridiaceae bacterium]
MDKKDIKILGIETSCDETSASVVVDGRKVLSNIISSQIDLHSEYGGVVPEIASRKHVELIIPVIDSALNEAGVTLSDIDGIAVTYGPGLVGALLVGISAAKAIAAALNKPLLSVHHIEGHIAANYISDSELEPPFICLVASGGHSHIVHVKDYLNFEILGRTRDDAAGEAFDKIARVLDLG